MHSKINIDGCVIDHIDLNKSNNKINNLRIATLNENKWNQNKTKIKTTSKYKGVSLYLTTNKWKVQITYQGKQIHLGYFDDEVTAALMYDAKAFELRGDKARLNFPH